MKQGPTAAELDEIDADDLDLDDLSFSKDQLDLEEVQLDGALIRVKPKPSKGGTGVLEAWDGADQAYLRERLKQTRGTKIYIDLSHLRHLHEGTFEIFRAKVEKGHRVVLLNPTPQIREMLWFRLFTIRLTESMYLMLAEHEDHAYMQPPIVTAHLRNTVQDLHDAILQDDDADEDM